MIEQMLNHIKLGLPRSTRVAKVFVGLGGASNAKGTTIPHSTNVIGTYTKKLKFWDTIRDDLGTIVDLTNSRFVIPTGYKECRITYNLAFGLVTWGSTETLAVGDTRIPSVYGSFQYEVTAITTGITGASEPTWPTVVGNTVVDGGVTWTCRATGWGTGWRGCRIKNSTGANYGNLRLSTVGDGTTTNLFLATTWMRISTNTAPDSIAPGGYFELYPTQTSGQPMTCGADTASSFAAIEIR